MPLEGVIEAKWQVEGQLEKKMPNQELAIKRSSRRCPIEKLAKEAPIIARGSKKGFKKS